MKENHKNPEKNEQDVKLTTPAMALERLKQGNHRFLNQEMHQRDHHWHIKKTIGMYRFSSGTVNYL